MANYNSIAAALEAAKKIVQKKINETLLAEVAEVIKVAESNSVIDDVYSRPTSGVYKRRYGDEGLADINNMHEDLLSDGVVSVYNDTPFNPYKNGYDDSMGISQNAGRGVGLDGLVNFGDGWNGTYYDYGPKGATHFIEGTREDLRNSKAHLKALKEGLIKRGLDVK